MNPEFQNDNTLGEVISKALLQFFKMLVFVLFVCPFNFWRKAAQRLVSAGAQWSWTNISSQSPWPFFSFLKAVLFGFIFDGLIFISYFIGVIVAFYLLFSFWLSDYGSFKYGFEAFICCLISTYYLPMGISPIRDFLYIIIMPFAKFLSWCSRPAQYLQIDMKTKKEG